MDEAAKLGAFCVRIGEGEGERFWTPDGPVAEPKEAYLWVTAPGSWEAANEVAQQEHGVVRFLLPDYFR